MAGSALGDAQRQHPDVLCSRQVQPERGSVCSVCTKARTDESAVADAEVVFF